jgi:hypothetical protein
MATTYRGYDITPTTDGKFGIHSMGSHPPVTETFDTEEKAMDYIDSLRRKELRK